MGGTLALLCVGTALVDSIIRGFDPAPVSASGYRAESGSLNVGGEAVNVAMAAAKLGLRAGILCFLGADAAGDMVEQSLSRCGVDVSRVLKTAEHPTPVTTMFVRPDGTRRSITNAAHRWNFRPDLRPEALHGTRAVVLGSLFRAPFDDPAVIQCVLTEAKKAGALIFADTKLPNFTKLGLAELKDALPLIDYLTPNEDEARYYTGRDDPAEMAAAFLECGVKNVIVKLGGRGCYFRSAETELRLPACPVRAVDATGAGDNFLAGFAAEILRGADAETALRFANACGAICATKVGASAALKSCEQVLAFLRAQEE